MAHQLETCLRRRPIKVVTIGFGEHFPNLIDSIYLRDTHRQVAEIVVNDIDPRRLELAAGLLAALNRETGRDIRVVCCEQLTAELLTGATHLYFCAAVRYGAMVIEDDELCDRLGVPIVEGETAGPGALLKTLRHLKVLMPACKLAEEVCPDAWMIISTNPIRHYVDYVARHTKLRTFGLCHGSECSLECVERGYGMAPHTLSGELAGVNHLLFYTRIWFTESGEDAYPYLRQLFREQGPNDWVQQHCLTITDMFGLLPGNWGHVGDFFGLFPKKSWPREQFHTEADGWRQRLAAGQTNHWLKRFQAVHDGQTTAASLLEQIGSGTHCIVNDVMNDNLFGEQPVYRMGMGAVANAGAVRELPPDAILELPVVICRNYVAPVCVSPLPPACLALLQLHARIASMITDGAATGSRALIRQALALDPMIHDIQTVDRLLDAAIAAHPDYYPHLA